MRSHSEDAAAFNQLLQSGRFSHSRKVLTDDVLVTKNGSLVNFFDANGADRTVTLPELEEGRFYIVANVGTADDLLVRSSTGTLITTLLPADMSVLVASDLEWMALRGWAALGVFTNTINGLVPAPNSMAPGSLFLRDDGQWAQVQVVGIVDAFKFMTDGTNTAIGSGPDTFYFRSSTNKIGITVTNGEAIFGDNVNLTVNEAQVDHDLLLNFFANEHIDHTTVSILTPALGGLTGGGTIAADRSISLNFGGLAVDTPVLADSFAFFDVSGSDHNRNTFSALNGILDHNALLNYVANRHIDHTAVSITASTGLTGGGDISANRSLALDFNSLTADAIATGDFIPFYDISGGDHNKITFGNFNTTLDHNSLNNYVANQHINHTSVTLTAGTGLTGGGDISASRSFALANMATMTIKSNITGGTAAPGDNTLTQILDVAIGSTRGMIAVRGAAVWQALGIGANNTVLQSNGTDPSWGTVAGSGTVTNVATAGLATGGPITTTGTVTVTAATQSDQETATSTTTVVTPAVQQFHPSALKYWVRWNESTATLLASYNHTSYVKNSTGNATLTIATDFSSANYAMTCHPAESGGYHFCTNMAAGTIDHRTQLISTNAAFDSTLNAVLIAGDQ